MKITRLCLAALLALVTVATLGLSASAAPGKVYEVAIFEDPTTMNIWAALGPDATVWNAYAGYQASYITLYGNTPPDMVFVPVVAADLPTPLKAEKVGATTYFTSNVKIRSGMKWSDGTPITADDVVFSYMAPLALDPNKLGGNWPSNVDPVVLYKVEKVDGLTVKFYLKEMPGLAQWQYGVLQNFVIPRAYWGPIVDKALKAADPVKELLAYDPVGEPLAGYWKRDKWEKGAFISYTPNQNYPLKGEKNIFYANGAFAIEHAAKGFKWSIGDTKGAVKLTTEDGPHASSLRLRILQNQSAAVLSLISGQVDYILNSLGLQRGFQDQLKKAANVATIENSVNGFRYMGFNISRYPFNIKEFRQAVAILVDREYICEKVLQGTAFPQYSVVPPGNAFWFNPNVKQWGKGLTRSQRVAEAVAVLKSAGFKWDVEPQVDLKTDKVTRRGKGLICPDGNKMQPFEFMVMTAGYDPLRYTFGLNIAAWMKEVGIPVDAVPTEFNVVSTKTKERDFDAFMMGWSLTLYPDHMDLFFNSSQAPAGGFNYTMYSNPEFDRLAADFVAEADLAKARDKAFKLQELVAEELPYIVLFDTPIIEAYRPDRVQYPFTKTLSGLQFVGGLTNLVKVND